MGKFLGEAGIAYLWGKVKALVGGLKYAGANEAGGTADRAASIPFGQVDSTSTSTVFTATVDGVTELRDGVCVYLRNGVVGSASGFTLNINGLGAKPCYSSMDDDNREATLFTKGMTVLFVYNSSRVAGGCWDFYRGYYSDTTHCLREYYSNRKVSDLSKSGVFLFTSADGSMWVPGSLCGSKSNAEKLLKEVNQRPIDPFGSIVIQSSGNYSAGAVISGTILYHQRFLAMGYAFNRTGALPTMSVGLPVYVKCAPRNDGSAVIDAEEPYVQALPKEEDGKIYIFLGVAYNATSIEMWVDHPVYYYKDGGIRQWTGMEDSGMGLDVRVIPSRKAYALTSGDCGVLSHGMLLVKTRVLKDTEELRLAYKTVRKVHNPVKNLMTLREKFLTAIDRSNYNSFYEYKEDHYGYTNGNFWDGAYVGGADQQVYRRKTVWKTLAGVALEPQDTYSGGVLEPTGGFHPCKLAWDEETEVGMMPIRYLNEDGIMREEGCAEYFSTERWSTLLDIARVMARARDDITRDLLNRYEHPSAMYFSFMGQNSKLRKHYSCFKIGQSVGSFCFGANIGVAIYDTERREIVELVPLELFLYTQEENPPMLYVNAEDDNYHLVLPENFWDWNAIALRKGENKRRRRYSRM